MTRYKVIREQFDTQIPYVTSVEFEKNIESQATLCIFETMQKKTVEDLDMNEEIRVENVETGDVEFRGNIKQLPSGDTKSAYTVKARQKIADAFNFPANNRIFYETDSGEVMRDLIQEDIREKGLSINNTGDDLSQVTSNAPVFELGNFPRISPQQVGDDIVFLGFPDSLVDKTRYNVTFSDIQPDGDRIQQINIRMILNNNGGVFNFKVQYISPKNENMVWDLGDRLNGVVELELSIDEAEPIDIQNGLDPSADAGKLRISIELDGDPIENKAIAVDFIESKSVDIVSRNTDYNNVNIPDLGRDITRQFSGNVNSAIFGITEEENGRIHITASNNVEYRIIGESTSDYEIIKNETKVVDLEVDADVEKIRNRVIVQGDNDIIAVQRNDASINFFGFTKTLKRRDQSIKNQRDAERKADKLLEKLAFKDAEITWTVPTAGVYDNIRIGDNIKIEWDTIRGQFNVKSVEFENNGWAEITVDAETRDFK